jgi:AcrR family transcriptional regulator
MMAPPYNKRPEEADISTTKNRVRGNAEVTRALLLDATERLMVSEGYASVTTRRVASIAGLTAALVHYYFRTTDDLLLATYRRAVERHDAIARQALGGPRPLHALWNLLSDSSRMALGIEFMAMANHRKAIRAEIRRHSEDDRKLHAKAVARVFNGHERVPGDCSPLCAAMLLSGITRGLVMDEVLGVSCAHADTRAFIERMLARLERSAPRQVRRIRRGGPAGHARKSH